jgi:hypothetical protein
MGDLTVHDASDDDSLDARTLRALQHNSFNYFVNEVNDANGLVLDKTTADWPASIAAMGLALSSYPVGVQRKFMTRDQAIHRTLVMLQFLLASEQSDSPEATGYKGFYYHFLNMQTGRRAWQCELSSIDTALLVAGVLLAAAYFDGTEHDERRIRDLARSIYERIDWEWMLAHGDTICHGWRPEHGFLPHRWEGYDEALILYVLALGSPTHPIAKRSYDAWCRTYEWMNVYDIDYLYAGPLFVHQMSHIWIDFRAIQDQFMRDRGSDYFENSRRATLIQQEYAIRNPFGFKHFGPLCWGITASDGPGFVTRKVAGVERNFYDYVARGAPYGPDDGTLAPWAVVASLPFAPQIVIPTISNLSALHVHARTPYGFKASFNPAFQKNANDRIGWVSPYHFGVNEGPTVLMIENYRTGLIWNLMRGCAYIANGLKAAGFSGGWLG